MVPVNPGVRQTGDRDRSIPRQNDRRAEDAADNGSVPRAGTDTMKVAIIHNQLSRGGGMESYLLALLRGFTDAGDEVHVHTYEVDPGVASLFPCTVHRRNLFLLPRRLRKYWFLHQCNRHFDRSRYDLSLSLTRTACQDIAVIGGVHPESVARAGRRNPYRRLHDRVEIGFEARMLAEVPCILAHSRSIRKDILRHYPTDPGKIRVVYPPLDTGRFREVSAVEREETVRRYNIGRDRMTLLFPSLGHRRKGLHSLVDAFSRLDPDRFQLLVAGEATTGYSLPASVRHIGYIENLSALYCAVDYVVLPSSYEPFGLVVAEALQCGTPVLVTRGVGAAELLAADEGVVIPDNRPATLLAAISKLEKKRVRSDFARRNGLVIDQHIEAIRRFAAEQA